jgi:hypothetical protein
LAVASELPKSPALRVSLISLAEILPVKVMRSSLPPMSRSSTNVSFIPLDFAFFEGDFAFLAIRVHPRLGAEVCATGKPMPSSPTRASS